MLRTRSTVEVHRPKLPRASLLFLTYVFFVFGSGAALVLWQGPAEVMILFIGAVIFAAIYYPRRTYLAMVLVLTLVSLWVVYNNAIEFAASSRTLSALFLAVMVAAEVIRRSVTGRARAEEALRETNQNLTALIEASPLAIAALDLDLKVRMWNKAAERLFGWTEAEVIGRPNPIVPAERREEFLDVQSGLRQGQTYTNFETYRQRKDGTQLCISLSTATLYDGKGNVNGAMAVIADITELKRAQEMVRHQAHHDALTGLPNRLLLNDRLNMALSRIRRNQQLLAAMFLDLDNFKTINDSFGHVVGDRLLQSVAQRLAGYVRQGDTIARLGGDEFILLLEIDQEDDAVKLGERIIHGFNLPFMVDGRELRLTTSMGISLFPLHCDDPADLLRNADTALYCAKQSGKNSYHVYDRRAGEEEREASLIPPDVPLK